MNKSPAWDTNLECRHGRQPFDPCPSPDGQWARAVPCRCFPVEQPGFEWPVAKVIPLRRKRKPPRLGDLCCCGCGEKTSGTRRGGYVTRFRPGHNNRKAAA